MKTILIILLTINLGFSQEYGIASHYSIRTNGGTHTASGIPLRDDSYTFAHKTLPFGTIAKITNLSNGKSVMVKVTDDGPHIKGRIADLSQAAAKKLGFLEKGLTRVRLEVITLGKGKFR
jgi:rare lipoprotein A